MLMSVPEHAPEQGFTLLEVLIAVSILTVGLLSTALLTTRMMGTGRQSKYMSMAAMLASEKLEDLNRWSADDYQVCVPAGNASIGNLGADSSQSVTCPNGAASPGAVYYYDDVFLGETNDATICPGGANSCFTETLGANGQYTTTSHSPNGLVSTATNNTAPATTTFHRRWIIEKNVPVAMLFRVTVLVTLTDASVSPSVSFQMSTVRPGPVCPSGVCP